jgi:hypothetical protein
MNLTFVLFICFILQCYLYPTDIQIYIKLIINCFINSQWIKMKKRVPRIFETPSLLLCAVHTYNLEGASPLWRSKVTNH